MASPPGAAPGRLDRRTGAEAVSDVCPLVRSADGGWRSVHASRDHRCWAIAPPAQLAVAKQRQLCLTPGYAGCATYLAAAGEWSDSVAVAAPPQPAGSLLWPAVRGTPLALEPSRGRAGSLAATPGRTGGQALLVALMVIAFLVLVVARTATPSTPGPSASPVSAVGVAGSATPSGATSSGSTATFASAPSGSSAPSVTAASARRSAGPSSTSVPARHLTHRPQHRRGPPRARRRPPRPPGATP